MRKIIKTLKYIGYTNTEFNKLLDIALGKKYGDFAYVSIIYKSGPKIHFKIRFHDRNGKRKGPNKELMRKLDDLLEENMELNHYLYEDIKISKSEIRIIFKYEIGDEEFDILNYEVGGIVNLFHRNGYRILTKQKFTGEEIINVNYIKYEYNIFDPMMRQILEKKAIKLENGLLLEITDTLYDEIGGGYHYHELNLLRRIIVDKGIFVTTNIDYLSIHIIPYLKFNFVWNIDKNDMMLFVSNDIVKEFTMTHLGMLPDKLYDDIDRISTTCKRYIKDEDTITKRSLCIYLKGMIMGIRNNKLQPICKNSD